jgi:hypothetical protein
VGGRAWAAVVARGASRVPALRAERRAPRVAAAVAAWRAVAREVVVDPKRAASTARRRQAQLRADSNHDSQSSRAWHKPDAGPTQILRHFREHGSAFFQARKASAPHFEFYDGSIPSRQVWGCDPVIQKGLTFVLRALPHARDLRRQRFMCVPAWIELRDRVRRARVCALCGLRFTHLAGSHARELL